MILVVGQPRTGTSLCMQMLDKAGCHCMGEYPGFEPGCLNTFNPPVRFDLIQEAGKIMWTKPVNLPRESKVIITDRSIDQQALSKWKFGHFVVQRVMKRIPRSTFKAMTSNLGRTQKEILREAKKCADHIVVKFDDTLADPIGMATRISKFIGKGDPHLMAGCVVERSANCYDGMLELELMKSTGIT